MEGRGEKEGRGEEMEGRGDRGEGRSGDRKRDLTSMQPRRACVCTFVLALGCIVTACGLWCAARLTAASS